MVITIADGVLGIASDGRDGFKRWGKRVRPGDVDLTVASGRALGGEWLTWGKSAALEEGDYLVLAAETGSRASHSYKYRLGQVRSGELVRIDQETRDALFARSTLKDTERAAVANNILYAYAAYINYAAQAAELQSYDALEAAEMAEMAEAERHEVTATSDTSLSAVPTEALLAELRRRGLNV